MGRFISVRIDEERCLGTQACADCLGVCPVDVFREEEGLLTVDPENEDECTLCELCLRACPQDALRVIKLYE